MNKKLLFLLPLVLLPLGCGNKQNICRDCFTVTWIDYEGTVLEIDKNVEKGTMPSYDSGLPTREATAQYTFEFKAWSPILTPVEKDVTYMATYSATINEYRVTWQNYDGEVLLVQENVPYGTEPYYDIVDTPEKPSTIDKSYFFDGWEPAIAPITGNTVFTATYRESTRCYLITWKNWNNKTLKITSVNYGSMPVYDGINPTHVADETYTYEFSGWSPEVTTCTGDATYIAQFTAIPIE